MSNETFETQVLVSLAEIKGEIALVRQQGDNSSERLDGHEKEIKDLKAHSNTTRGIALAFAVIIPIFISIVGILLRG